MRDKSIILFWMKFVLSQKTTQESQPLFRGAQRGKNQGMMQK